MGIENTDEYENLTSSGNQHIIYTDWESIPDMAPIIGSQSLYQLQGDSNESKWNLHTDVLPCSCSPCRCDPSNRDTCTYKEDRDLKTNIVSLKVTNNNENKDPNGINKLAVPELKVELRTRVLIISGNEPEIKVRLVQYLENNEVLDNDEINETDDTVINGGAIDAIVVNINATVIQSHSTNTTVVGDGITGTTVINDDTTISS